MRPNCSITKPGLNLWPKASCLIEALLERLITFDRERLASTLVVVPTLRLGTYLQARLAQHFGAFIPPEVCTLEQWVGQQAINRPRRHPALTGLELELLLAQIVAAGEFSHVRPGQERELAQLFSELTSSGIGSRGFIQLRQKLADDCFHNPDSLEQLARRSDEVEEIWNQLHQQLDQREWETAALQLSRDAAYLVEQNPDQRPAFLLGFTSVNAAMMPVVRMLGTAWPDAEIWLSTPPDLYSPVNPLTDLVEQLGKPHVVIQEKKEVTPSLQVRFAEHRYAEVDGVIREVQACLAAGCPPSSIAILLADESNYGNMLRAGMNRAGLRANFAISVSFHQTMLGSWINLFCDFLCGGETITDLLAWLHHPLWQGHGQTPPLNPAALTEVFCQRGVDKGLQAMINALADTEYRTQLERLDALLKPWLSSKRHRANHWCETLQDLLKAIGFEQTLEATETDHGLRQSSVSIIQQYCRAMERLRPTNIPVQTSRSFLSQMRQQVNRQDARSIGEPLAGIQVLSIPEARYFPFHRVFILGCLDGQFPKGLPRDELFDDYLKRGLGLAGWQALEAREDLTFHLLSSRLPHLYLCYPTQQLGEATIPSRFIEQVHLSKAGRAYAMAFDSSKEFACAPLERKTTAMEDAEEGHLQGDWRRFFEELSASRLAELISCPYRFLLGRLGLADLMLPDQTKDPRREGEWLHKVLERFFQQWPDDLAAENFELFALDRLQRLTQELAPNDAATGPLLIHLDRFAWPRFVRHLMAVHPDLSRPRGAREKSFAAQLPFGGESIALVGKIDSIDEPEPGVQILTDYKRKRVPTRKQVQDGIEPQLALYSLAIASEPENAPRQLVGYWSILNGEWHGIAGSPDLKAWATERGLASKNLIDVGQIQSAAESIWQWRKEEISTGRFAADPSYCGHCRFSGVCRRDDPEHEARLANQRRLEDRQGGGT